LGTGSALRAISVRAFPILSRGDRIIGQSITIDAVTRVAHILFVAGPIAFDGAFMDVLIFDRRIRCRCHVVSSEREVKALS
jgi:hypothetical protein